MLLSAKTAYGANPATNPKLKYYAQYSTVFREKVTAPLEVTQVSDDEDGEPCFDIFERWGKSTAGVLLSKVRAHQIQPGAELGDIHRFTLIIEEVAEEKSRDESEPAR
jgi:hypothetical protein